MIKAVIFDFGNVICTFDNAIFLKKIRKHTKKTLNELDRLIYQESGLPKKYETGQVSSEEFYKKIVQLCGLTIQKKEFIDAYTQIFTPIPQTYDLIRRLKGKYKLALLSNTSEWDFNHGIKKILNTHNFDAISLSYKTKTMKPDTKIYEDCLKKLGLKPSECVYIDDIKKYSDQASSIGMIGINYISPKQLENELKKLGIKYQ